MAHEKVQPEELEILKSPEKIDQAARLVLPRYWIFFLAIGIMLLLTIIWSFVTQVPVYVSGRGILINESGISEIRTQFPGKVSDLKVKIGQRVEQGDVLATVEQLELAFEVKKLEAQLREYKETLDWLLQNENPASRQQNIAGLRQQIAANQRRLDAAGGDDLAAESERTELRKQIQEAKSKLFDLENYRKDRVFELQNNLLMFESDLQFKKNQLVSQTSIVSPYTGTIIDMSFDNGDIFEKGSKFVVIENENYKKNELIALVYINAVDGKKVKNGMPVQLAPSTVAPEEYGYMLGEVNFVSKYTLSESGMNRVLRNEKVVTELAKDGLPMVIQVKLATDSATFSKYRWTTRQGPATEIISGTMLRANIIINQKRPISFIFPSL